MENKERFLSIYREHIHREGSEKILDYLLSEHSDFFRAPASTRFHGAHDICKINCYKESTRNQKVNGQWVQVPFYEYEDRLPYGHGEKSVYIITGFMRLSREEAFAIRYHMGFSGSEEVRNVGAAFEMYPLAFALSTADMEATYYLEGK